MLERSDAIPESLLPKNSFFSTKNSEMFDLTRKVRSLLAAQQKISAPPRAKDQVFISYSHKDRKFLDELLVHLRPLERAKRVTSWSDKQIQPGDRWFGDIKQALTSSKVVVMLLTSNFLASDFIHEHELGPVLKEAEAGGVKILWIMVRACSYQETALRDYQAVLPLDKPLAEMKAERDSAWVEICKAIKKATQ
jgi:internalin A